MNAKAARQVEQAPDFVNSLISNDLIEDHGGRRAVDAAQSRRNGSKVRAQTVRDAGLEPGPRRVTRERAQDAAARIYEI